MTAQFDKTVQTYLQLVSKLEEIETIAVRRKIIFPYKYSEVLKKEIYHALGLQLNSDLRKAIENVK